MSFWKKIRQLSQRTYSLQEHINIYKSREDPNSFPRVKKAKEASCFVPRFPEKSAAGSITAEAAMVLPLFLFAVVNLMSLFLMFHRYSAELAELHQQTRQLSMLAYGLGEQDGRQDIRLMKLSVVRPVVPVLGFPGITLVNGCVMHKWIGFDLSGSHQAENQQEAEELVFVTKSGVAYHKDRSCIYLNPAVTMVSRQEAQKAVNQEGVSYQACGACGGRGEMVYITAAGERYHGTISCSGLKRTISSVPLTEAQAAGKHACPGCG